MITDKEVLEEMNELTNEYVSKIIKIFKREGKGQLLILIHGSDFVLEGGWGCEACAAQVCAVYAIDHVNDKHVGESGVVH